MHSDDFDLPTDASAIDIDTRGYHRAHGVAVCGIAIPPNERDWPPGPALILAFRYLCPTHGRFEVAKFVVPNDGTNQEGPPGAGVEAFADLIVNAARVAVDQYEPGVAKALDAMAAYEAGLDPQLAPSCPGCGARLFGDVATRGACLACFPEAPADDVLDQAATLDAGEPA